MKEKILFYVVLLFTASMFLTSCDVDYNTVVYPQPLFGYWQPYASNGNGQYVIGGYVNGQQGIVATRAAIESGMYQEFSLYSWTKDSVVMDKFTGVFQGNTWSYSEPLKYFDNDVAEYKFIGVIPTTLPMTLDYANNKLTVSDVPSFTVNDARALANSATQYYDTDEFLYSAAVVGKSEYANGATLNFTHGNSKIFIQFKSNRDDTKILDFTPTIAEVPATDPVVVTEQKTVQFIDELVAGNPCGWPYAVDNVLSSNPTSGSYVYCEIPVNNASFAMTDEIMNAVNAQFNYYDEYGNAYGDWEKDVNKKNKIFIELKDAYRSGFASGNDEFYTRINQFTKDNRFSNPYANGARVVRMNRLPSDNTKYGIWIGYNTNMTVDVIKSITPGTPYQPAQVGIDGIIVLPATSTAGDGSDAVLSSYASKADCEIAIDGITMTQTESKDRAIFAIPQGNIGSTAVYSPTTWFALPTVANDVANLGFTIKFSYEYNGVKKYDNRVFVKPNEAVWVGGKYYTYIININGKGNGFMDAADADKDDPQVNYPNGIYAHPNITNYEEGNVYNYNMY